MSVWVLLFLLFGIYGYAIGLYAINCKTKVLRRERTSSRVRAPIPSNSRAKPAWIKKRVLYLAAHMPHAGCRTIGQAFNRWHRHASVGKTWVAECIKANAAEIASLRCSMRSRQPVVMEAGHWALDLSYWRSENGQLLTVLGIADQGSRRLLCLKQVPRKCVLTLLGHLLLAMTKFGIPKTLRTDNEAMFTW